MSTTTAAPMTGQAYLPRQQKTALWLFATGKTYREIAEIMGISLSTVKEHLNRAYRGLGARNGAQAVHLAYQGGLFEVQR